MAKIQFLTILLAVTCFLGGVVSVTDKEIKVCNAFYTGSVLYPINVHRNIQHKTASILLVCPPAFYHFIVLLGLYEPHCSTATTAERWKQGTFVDSGNSYKINFQRCTLNILLVPKDFWSPYLCFVGSVKQCPSTEEWQQGMCGFCFLSNSHFKIFFFLCRIVHDAGCVETINVWEICN